MKSLDDFFCQAHSSQRAVFQRRNGFLGDVPMLQRKVPTTMALPRVQALAHHAALQNFLGQSEDGDRSAGRMELCASLDRERAVRNLAVHHLGDVVCAVHHPTLFAVFAVDAIEEMGSVLQPLVQFRVPPHRPSTRVASLKFVSDQSWVVTSYDNAPFVDVFDLEVVDERDAVPSRRCVLGAGPDISASDVLPLSERVTLAACSDGAVRAVDVRAGTTSALIKHVASPSNRVFGLHTSSHTSPLTALVGLPSGAGFYVSTGAANGAVTLYDLRCGAAPLQRWEALASYAHPITTLHIQSYPPYDIILAQSMSVGRCRMVDVAGQVQRNAFPPMPMGQRLSTRSIIAEDLNCVLTPWTDAEGDCPAKVVVTDLGRPKDLDVRNPQARDRSAASIVRSSFVTASAIFSAGKRSRGEEEGSGERPPLVHCTASLPGVSSCLTACARLTTPGRQLALLVGTACGRIRMM